MAVRRIARESQQTEYKSSWQDEYLEWICGYANSRGGKLYVGVNDDGYVVGLADTRFLLDELPKTGGVPHGGHARRGPLRGGRAW